MPNQRDVFRTIDEVRAPDLSAEIRHRMAAEPHRRPHYRQTSGEDAWSRGLAAAVAIAVFAAAGVFAWRAFQPTGAIEQPAPLAAEGDPVIDVSEIPDVARIQCFGDGRPPEVLTPVVRPQTDGVHIRVIPFDDRAGYSMTVLDGLVGGPTWGWSTPGNPDTFVFEIPGDAGELLANCAPEGKGFGYDKLTMSDVTSFELVDPAGMWVATPPYACDRPLQSEDHLAGQGAAHTVDTMPELSQVRSDRAWVRETDDVYVVGYPGRVSTAADLVGHIRHEEREIVVERDDRAIATILHGAAYSSLSICPGVVDAPLDIAMLPSTGIVEVDTFTLGASWNETIDHLGWPVVGQAEGGSSGRDLPIGCGWMLEANETEICVPVDSTREVDLIRAAIAMDYQPLSPEQRDVLTLYFRLKIAEQTGVGSPAVDELQAIMSTQWDRWPELVAQQEARLSAPTPSPS